MKTLIKHVTILTMDDADRVLRDGWLLIDGEKIAALGEAEPQSEEGGAAASGCSSAGGSSATAQAENSLDSAAASARTTAASQPIENQQQATAARPIENLLQAEAAADEVIDGRGGILLPGFVNTHCHVSMVPFRSMGDDCPDRLRRFLFPLELEAMTPELVYWGALYGIAEMFLSGTTTFLDMYYFEDRVAEACEQAGIRGYLGETLIGQKTCDSPDEEYGGFAYQKDFFAEYHGARHPRIHPIIAPHGTTTLSPEKLREAHALAVQYDTIFTLHASEMDYEMEHFRAMGMTPTAFLDSIGALDAHTLAAHCIHMTEEDLQLLKARGAGIAHCICSNTKAGKGVARPPATRSRCLTRCGCSRMPRRRRTMTARSSRRGPSSAQRPVVVQKCCMAQPTATSPRGWPPTSRSCRLPLPTCSRCTTRSQHWPTPRTRPMSTRCSQTAGWSSATESSRRSTSRRSARTSWKR